LTGEAGNASRRKVIVEATARSLEWASAWRTQDESGPTFSRVIRTNFGDRMAKIFRENSDSLVILTLGTAFIINKAVNGQFLFSQKTDSAQKLDDLTQTVSQLSLS
jgi:hypothetical protein